MMQRDSSGKQRLLVEWRCGVKTGQHDASDRCKTRRDAQLNAIIADDLQKSGDHALLAADL